MKDDTGALLALAGWTLAVFILGMVAGWYAHEGQCADARRCAAERAALSATIDTWRRTPQRLDVVFPPGWTCEGWGIPRTGAVGVLP